VGAVSSASDWVHPLTGVHILRETAAEGPRWNCTRCGRAIPAGVRYFHLRPPLPLDAAIAPSPLRETRFHSRDCLVHHLEAVANQTEEHRWYELAASAATGLPSEP
jgi:hypothetical protein